MVKKKLNGKDALIVYDNIEYSYQMDAIFFEDILHPGSAIIVTTRDQSIFGRHAFHSDPPFAPFENLVHQFVNVCKGLPLALEELGRAIVDEECPKYAGRRSRLWRPSDVKYVLQNSTGTEIVRGLTLVSGERVAWNADESGNRCAWNTDSFANMKELQLLVLKDDCLQGDFGKLSQKLLFLRWTNFPYDHMPLDLHTKQIRILDVAGGKLVNLWNNQSQLPLNLRELNMHNCQFLNRVPESMAMFKGLLKYLPLGIRRMKRLQFLDLKACDKLKVLPESFGQLPALRSLYMEGCTNVKNMEGSFENISTLREVDVVCCGKLKTLSSWLTHQRSLTEVRLGNLFCPHSRIGYHHGFLPNDIEDLREFIKSDLWGITNSRELPQSIGFSKVDGSVIASIGKLSDLKTLYLSALPLLERTPSFHNVSSLISFQLNNCPRVKKVDLGHLKNLFHLDLSSCSGLQYISGVCTSQNLSYMNISGDAILGLHDIKQLTTLIVHVSEAFSSENHLWLENLPPIVNVHFIASAIPYVNPIGNLLNIEATSAGQELTFQFLPTRELFNLGIFKMSDYHHSFDLEDKTSVRVSAWTDPLQSSAIVYLKEGWIRRIGEGEEHMIHNIWSAFFKEIRQQRLLSDAREHAPSQLNLLNLHALDIANCRIQRLCLLDDTPIQVEEMEFVYKRKQLLWGNDKALKHLDLSIMDTNLRCTIKSMANLYKMEVMISSRGKVMCKDELQEYDKFAFVNKDDEVSFQVFRNILKSRELLRNEIESRRNEQGKKRKQVKIQRD
eukprot:Gb_33213 [translate_table: standard]